jgi:hypothetical protein
MYCKKCNIVVHGVGHDICPKCNDRLESSQELLHAESGDAIDWQKLKDLISDIDAAAEPTKKLKTDKEREALFALGKTLSTEDTRLQNTAAVSAERVEKSASGFTRAKDIPDIAAKGFAPEPAPQPVLNQNQKYGMMNSLFIIFAVLIVAGVAAAYYLFFIESEPAKQAFVLFEKTDPVRVPQAQKDEKNLILKPTVQAHKSADSRQPEPDKKDASQPMAVAVSKTAAPPARKAGTLSPAIKEKHAEPAQASASIEEKQAQFPAEGKKVIAPPQKETAANATVYCINVASCKLKESADAVLKDLQKKGYEPAVDTVTVKDTIWYRVTVGHFQTQGEAQNYARELQGRENIRGFVVKKKY